ncbi:HEPN domain-containing protein [Candidatus Micrarchaeota archaeon]|nr:HEPN domain-containing protein [Candidatus Micrarchaeota archaeon]
MIDFNDCIEKGLLRKIPPSKRQSEEQLKKARVLLEEAKKALKINSPNSAVLSAYTSMLDAARAVLFRDGFREKSHACVARYLETKYSKEVGISNIDLFDQYRDKRHKTMYAGDYYPTDDEAQRIVSFAEEFVKKIEALLKL